ncbi:MAG: DoxX family protein [Saprospiraceae bacterium]
MKNLKYWLYPGSNGIRIDLVLLLLRILCGGLLLTHGYMKMNKIIKGDLSFADPLGIGESISLFLTVFAEFICSILVVLGLFTRLACIPIIITMLVAIMIVHNAGTLSEKELAILYLIIFYSIYLSGPGKFSFDHNFFGTDK